eukprot:CAMPEP_0204448028 /NCGR_PEP_ID=MMETSP0470-20130426/97681_1 /ASSEMBLY_ACC=CAM_ASM_000385 /TAXON_ID=2969 /ORGANISM="Oxyrrhis marina" /LENGTH=59 /DNA_ID=CAMNT_0051447741 /DNA_START=82 /DNA_END=261 /DNA_ORIENTATION=+
MTRCPAERLSCTSSAAGQLATTSLVCGPSRSATLPRFSWPPFLQSSPAAQKEQETKWDA